MVGPFQTEGRKPLAEPAPQTAELDRCRGESHTQERPA
jgi:hypothetical protein